MQQRAMFHISAVRPPRQRALQETFFEALFLRFRNVVAI
jgi:hypothetical protein